MASYRAWAYMNHIKIKANQHSPYLFSYWPWLLSTYQLLSLQPINTHLTYFHTGPDFCQPFNCCHFSQSKLTLLIFIQTLTSVNQSIAVTSAKQHSPYLFSYLLWLLSTYQSLSLQPINTHLTYFHTCSDFCQPINRYHFSQTTLTLLIFILALTSVNLSITVTSANQHSPYLFSYWLWLRSTYQLLSLQPINTHLTYFHTGSDFCQPINHCHFSQSTLTITYFHTGYDFCQPINRCHFSQSTLTLLIFILALTSVNLSIAVTSANQHSPYLFSYWLWLLSTYQSLSLQPINTHLTYFHTSSDFCQPVNHCHFSHSTLTLLIFILALTSVNLSITVTSANQHSPYLFSYWLWLLSTYQSLSLQPINTHLTYFHTGYDFCQPINRCHFSQSTLTLLIFILVMTSVNLSIAVTSANQHSPYLFSYWLWLLSTYQSLSLQPINTHLAYFHTSSDICQPINRCHFSQSTLTLLIFILALTSVNQSIAVTSANQHSPYLFSYWLWLLSANHFSPYLFSYWLWLLSANQHSPYLFSYWPWLLSTCQ